MTMQQDIISDTRYSTYLDHGFVGLVDYMGTDADIEKSARISYGEGTREVSKTTQLIRYLWRHLHTSPFEMAEVKFHLKMPIFVARQFVRHRTASLNEYSGRYSEMSNEFYIPKPERIKVQSKSNKQGSGDVIDTTSATIITDQLHDFHTICYEFYENLLEKNIARELARNILPVSNYTEMYWKIDLKNFLHFIKLRMDSHAQEEIRELAVRMYEPVKSLFPITTQAFEDYTLHGKTFSMMEMELIRSMLVDAGFSKSELMDSIPLDTLGTKRERTEFIDKLFS